METTQEQTLSAQIRGEVPFKTYACQLLGIGVASLSLISMTQASPYVETGKAGQPNSWRSTEFKTDWGLGAINAQEAYAAGYSGKGIKLGIFDQAVYSQHPEFNSPNKVISLVTTGIREYTDPYIPVNAGDAFRYDGSLSIDSGGTFGAHGTHVGGIAAGNRDGGQMHGVAYNAQIIVADNGDPGPEDGVILGNDGAVYKAGWDALMTSGARIINNSWGIGVPKELLKGGFYSALPHFTVDDAQKQFDQILPLLNTKSGGAYAGAIASARSGIVTIFGAGNNGNFNNPDAIAGLAKFVPDIASSWITVSGLEQNPDTTSTIPYTFSSFSTRCGYAASFCVSAPATMIYSSIVSGTQLDNVATGYAFYNGTSMAAPHVAGATAVLMERFPYMTGGQVASTLKATATDLGDPGIDELYGWGMINLKKAIDGPAMFIADSDIPQPLRIEGSYGTGQFVADLPGIGTLIDAGTFTERRCTHTHCAFDVWRNDISGHGGLTKQGIGTLVLTGANTYSGPTLINQGRLAVNGSLRSAVIVNNGGTLGGNGLVAELTARRGSTVAPGNSIGTLQVAGDVTFEKDSNYAVELSTSHSDRIVAGAKALIKGGTVMLALENNPALLSHQQAKSLLGRQFNILHAGEGVQGHFDEVLPNYVFIGGHLNYSANDVELNIERNATSFASVAQTPNQRAVATAAEQLVAGNTLYESLLLSPSVASARHAFKSLSGELHPAVATQLINDSHYLRDAVGDRLRQPDVYTANDEPAGQNNVWVKALGGWGKTDTGSSYANYTTSLSGLLAGVDGLISEASRLGIFTGYSNSALNMGGGTHSSASTNSYHLGTYLGHEAGSLRLSVGGSYSWSRIDVKRDVQFADIDAKQKTKRDAKTGQIFTEAAYHVELQPMALEPFANLAYVNVRSDRFHEKGGVAALTGNSDTREAVLTTLGVRAAKTLTLNANQQIDLSGHLGWQHNLNPVHSKQDLSFVSGNTDFSVQSVSLARNTAVVGARVGVKLGQATRVDLDYNGHLNSKENTHGVGLNLSWQF